MKMPFFAFGGKCGVCGDAASRPSSFSSDARATRPSPPAGPVRKSRRVCRARSWDGCIDSLPCRELLEIQQHPRHPGPDGGFFGAQPLLMFHQVGENGLLVGARVAREAQAETQAD